MSAELKEKLRQGEAAAIYAAGQYAKYAHFAREWQEEWELIASRNQSIRDALRPKFPVLAEPIKLSIVEDEDAIQESVEHVGLSSEQGAGSVLRTVGDEAGESRAA